MTSVSTDQLLAKLADGGSAAWGGIQGDIADQADLTAALDAKLDEPTGTASATTYARGDGTWATPTNTTYTAITQAEAENAASTASRLVTGQRIAQAVAAYLTGIAGYSATETQSLKSVSGTLTWVTDEAP